MRKKLLSILLVLSLMLALVPAAFAAEPASGTCGAEGDGSNVIWTLDETGLLTISGTGKIASGTGGSIWSDKPVLAVDIRSGVTGVGKDAFYGCDDLQVISLPDTVTQLDDNAFGNCPALSDILVDAKNPAYKSVDGALYSKDGTVLVKGPANAETFVVPDGVATIGDYAFFGAKYLTSIYFPEGSLTTIGAMAFEFCEGLTELLLPAGVTEIGMYAFAHCSGLRSVDLPVSLKHVSDMAFLSAGTMDAGIADINYAEEIPLEELMFSQDFGFLARNLEQSVNLYRMSIGSDGSEQMELVVGEATKMFPAGGILCKRSGFGDYENQYFWQSKVFDGKLFLGTFDTSSLLEPLGQFTNGDLLKMSREEWASQIGYLRVLLKLLLNQDKNGDGTLMAADADPDAAIDAAVDAVSDESPELFTFTDAQHDTMRQELQNGVYNAYYSVSTLRQLNELNALLTELTDLVETNDIEGFVALYQKVNDLYASLSGKLPDALKKLYETLVRITELENMKDLCICLRKLSTATRGFGLYAITSEGGKLSLETLTRDGFGDPFNHGLRAFATNDEEGWMVIGTANPFMGTQLWRTNLTKADPMAQFTDVDENSWSYPGIRYCVENGLMSGIGNGLFAPQMTTTRAQMVQILYNLAGDPEVSGTTPFTDLTDDWYQDAVLWGYQTGVVAGTSETTFSPDDPVTREQAAVLLVGYAEKIAQVDLSGAQADLSRFPDGDQVSDWARTQMSAAVALGLISGVPIDGRDYLCPQDSATREQVATILMAFCRNVLQKP